MRSRLVALLCLAAVAGAACGGETDSGKVKVVASIYPLAWVAEQIGGDRVEVIDLTPPGVEAHDVQLTAEQRAEISEADIVIYLGPYGFQPGVEEAVKDARGLVVEAAPKDLFVLSDSDVPGLLKDPHIWMEPGVWELVARVVHKGLREADPAGGASYDKGMEDLSDALFQLEDDIWSMQRWCKYHTFVASHEAFGTLNAFGSRAGPTMLRQIGIEGLAPESAPSAERIEAAINAIESGEAAPVVFYEESDEGRRIAESVASDAGVPTLPLNTLESEPESGDYISIMRENLANLQEGLECKQPSS